MNCSPLHSSTSVCAGVGVCAEVHVLEIFKKENVCACSMTSKRPAGLGVTMCPESFDTSRCIIKTLPHMLARQETRQSLVHTLAFCAPVLLKRAQIPQRHVERLQKCRGGWHILDWTYSPLLIVFQWLTKRTVLALTCVGWWREQSWIMCMFCVCGCVCVCLSPALPIKLGRTVHVWGQHWPDKAHTHQQTNTHKQPGPKVPAESTVGQHSACDVQPESRDMDRLHLLLVCSHWGRTHNRWPKYNFLSLNLFLHFLCFLVFKPVLPLQLLL